MDREQSIIDRIQAIIADDVDAESRETRALNQELVASVKEANRRLRECDTLLRKGLRTEAIQKCDTEPNLLDVVAVLDFPEWNEWISRTRSADLDAPPNLLLDIAADLNAAYAAEQPLAHLLKRHRVLALAQAPLSERIETMRRIRSIDTENPVWDQDVRLFEKERFSQISNELQAAGESRDVAEVAALEKELASPGWVSGPPPKQLRTAAAKLHRKLRMAAARKEMVDVEHQLRAAFEELDEETARKWRDRWNALNRIAELPEDSDLARLAAPALQWVEERDRECQIADEHKQAVANLEGALERNGSHEMLNRLYHAATRSGRSLPSALEKRWAAHMEYLHTRSRRKHIVLLVGSVAVVLMVGTFISFLLQQRTRAREISTHATNIAALVEDEKLDEAESYRERLPQQPWLLDSPEIRKASEELNAALKKDQGRSTLLAQLLEKPQRVGVGELSWKTIEDAEAEVKRATELAKTEAERTLIEHTRSTVWQARRRLQSRVDEQFTTDLESFKMRIQRVSPDDVDAWKPLFEEIGELKNRPRVSDVLKTPLPGLEAVITERRNLAQKNAALAAAMADISSQVGNADGFAKALTAYVQTDPMSTSADDFKTVAASEVALWSGIAAWNQTKKTWNSIDFGRVSPKDADQLVKLLKSVEVTAKPIPMPPEIAALMPALSAIVARDDGTGKATNKALSAVLGDSLIANLRMVYTREKKRYYVKGTPRELGKRWLFDSYANIDMATVSHGSVAKDDVNVPLIKGEPDWRSPQSRFADRAETELERLAEDGWDSVHLDILELLHVDKDMDPIIKVILMQRVLDSACKGSVTLQQAFGEDMAILARFTLDPTTNWFDPDDARAKNARATASDLLQKIETLKKRRMDVKVAAAKLQQASARAPGPSYGWVGWLHRDAEGKFLMRSGKQVITEAGHLAVCFLPMEQNAPRFEIIGQIREGKAEIASAGSNGVPKAAFVAGRPIYLVVPLNTKKVAQSR